MERGFREMVDPYKAIDPRNPGGGGGVARYGITTYGVSVAFILEVEFLLRLISSTPVR